MSPWLQTASRISISAMGRFVRAVRTPGLTIPSLPSAGLKPSCRGPLRCFAAKGKAKAKEEGPYSSTVNLPVTSFDMRANSVVKEPQIQEFWAENQIYESLSRNGDGETYTLHDGPPYANGDLHIGHALNKILKDIINRYQLLQGRRARLVPGWDCHGLPIELKVLQSMDEKERRALTPLDLRKRAAEFALKTVDSQRTQFKRYGIWADWESPYVTLNPAYEAAQLRVFGSMLLNGHIYRGRKPVHWSPSSRTALAEAELEYPDGHTSRSIYVALPLQLDLSDKLSLEVKKALSGAALAVWTTTPWTIPANMAVAVNGELDYAVVRVNTGTGTGAASWASQTLVVAVDLISTLEEKFGVSLTQVAVLKGGDLEGAVYRHPLYDRISPVVIGGDYITTESGTGLVHTAPGHGQEDYLVGQQYGLPLLSPVDDAGRFTEEAGQFAGLEVQGQGNAAVIEALMAAGALLKEEEYAHKYPYDWRTKKPTIFRATDQWFASVEGFRTEALEAIRAVQWVPGSGENRITAMTEGRSDWCISRQRTWGVPIPVFYDVESGAPLMNEDTIQHITNIVEKLGSNAWWELSVEELLPKSLKHLAPSLRKGQDTMDVWFDSGSSWAGVLKSNGGNGSELASLNFPADLYLEGSDQHRGWFQSSLLTSVASAGQAPYKAVLTHGFVLDDKGFKMSKSLGNVVDPRVVIAGGKDQKKNPPYGADVLRLWVSSVDYSADVMIGDRILSQVADSYRKLRFTLRFLLGNLAGFQPEIHEIQHHALSATDRYILYKFTALYEECRAAYDTYQFFKIYQALQRFVVLDLSNFYLDVAKDRLYTRAEGSTERRACQTTLNALLRGMLPLIAPILPHMAEDAWQCLPYEAPTPSVFQAGWTGLPGAWSKITDVEALTWRAVLGIRAEVNQQLEKGRADKGLGSSLEARVLIHMSDSEVARILQALQSTENGQDSLRYLFIVSEATLVGSAGEVESEAQFYSTTEIDGVPGTVTVGVTKAKGQKCGRCWNYSQAVGQDVEHPELCERCLPVIKDMGFPAPNPTLAAVTNSGGAG